MKTITKEDRIRIFGYSIDELINNNVFKIRE